MQPSLEETFGKVTIEALACGTSIVCFNSTANPELVGDGCGLAVESGNTDAMYSAVNEILANGKEVYSANCLRFASDNFDKEKNLSQYMELFDRLING